jgi:hypothetical protein
MTKDEIQRSLPLAGPKTDKKCRSGTLFPGK